MMGPFKTARGGLTHLLVAVDKYTKWVEAKPIKKLDDVTTRNFVIDIVSRGEQDRCHGEGLVGAD